MSYSVLRRYTPPTCTLEIIGNPSPLSRWMNQPVLKNLRFQLNLDDPKLSKDEWVTLRGDRTQLEALCDAVSTYVQQFLEQAPISLNGKTTSSHLGGLAVLSAPESSPVLRDGSPNVAGISFQPKGLLSHELVLGSLATEETGSTVHLSTLQLFDLANALDEYTTEVVTLPNLQPARSGWLKGSPSWAKVAAVALVVVGLSTSIAKLLDGSYTAKTSAPTTSQGASSNDQKIATQLPPGTTEQPSTLPLPDQKLPPFPPIGSTISPGSSASPKVTVPSYVPPLPSTGRPLVASKPSERSSSSFAAKTRQDTSAGEGRQAQSIPAPLSAPQLKPELSTAAPSARASGSVAALNAGRQSNESAAQNSTAFDTIPQVAEARRYFQQRWTPPQGLAQTLEYRLVINSSGSIQQILPLGQTAGDYIDRTGMPLVGEPFVSAMKQQSATIRLVLNPDGKVQTFLESVGR